jgi:hypothetical protein
MNVHRRLLACVCILLSGLAAFAPTADAAARRADQTVAAAAALLPAATAVSGSGAGGISLETAATKAGETGRNVAMSLIGLALAVAAIVLAFRRDFREAAAVFAVGTVCVLLATPAGESLLRDTVKALVG